MRAFVNDNCIGCGLCAGTCPDVFQMTDEGRAQALADVPVQWETEAQAAADACPVDAIEIS